MITVDADKLHSALQPHVGAQGVPATHPAARYEQLTPVPLFPSAGQGLDREKTADTVRRTWLRKPMLEFPIVEVSPATTRTDVDQLVRELCQPRGRRTGHRQHRHQEIDIPPAAIAGSLRIESDDSGRLIARVDDTRLRQNADRAAQDCGNGAGGQPEDESCCSGWSRGGSYAGTFGPPIIYAVQKPSGIGWLLSIWILC